MDANYTSALNGFVASGYTDIIGASSAVQGQERFPADLITYIVSYRQRAVDQLIAAQSDSVNNRLTLIYLVGALILVLATIAVTWWSARSSTRSGT